MMYTKAFSLLALAGAAHAHMSMFYPPPLGGAPSINKQSTTTDTQFNYPLGCCDSDGPTKPSPGLCRGHLDKFDTEEASVTWEAGQDAHFQLTDYSYDPNAPGSTHYGGSCQVGFSVDKGATWKVAASYHGACPKHTEDGSPEAQTFDFKVPTGMPEGDALFAWIWLNREHESFMNCAKVKIGAGSGSTTPSQPAQSSPSATQPSTPSQPSPYPQQPDDEEDSAPPATTSRAAPRPPRPSATSSRSRHRPATTSSNSRTQPTQPSWNVNSKGSADSSENSDNDLENADNDSGNSDNDPANSNNDSANSNNDSANSNNDSENSDNDSENSDNDSENSDNDSENSDNDRWSSRPHRKVKAGSRKYDVDGWNCECRRETLNSRCYCDSNDTSVEKRAAVEKKALRMHRRTLYKRVDACDWASAPAMEVSYYTSDAKCAPNAKLNTPSSDSFELGWNVNCGVVDGDGTYQIKMMECNMYGA